MSILVVSAVALTLWSLISWNRNWSNPVLDERERDIRCQVRVRVSRAVELVQVILLVYVLAANLLGGLPQPSAFLVLCLLGAAGCAAEAVANYSLRREDLTPG